MGDGNASDVRLSDGRAGLTNDRVTANAELSRRMMRVIGSGGRRVLPTGQQVLLSALLVGAVAFGTWWTAAAVIDGNSAALVFRFGLSVMLGLYYLALCAFVPK